MSKLLLADPKMRLVGINNLLLLSVGNAAFFAIVEIFLARMPTFAWAYPWWGR